MSQGIKKTFLRSINLIYDAGSVDSVSHFYPTAKAVPLVNAILGNASDRSTFVIAPYGSGKSLTAAYALHLIENVKGAGASLLPVVEKFEKFDRSLFASSKKRLSKSGGSQGVVIALHGSVPELPAAIKGATLQSLKRMGVGKKAATLKRTSCETPDDIARFLKALLDFSGRHNIDRVAILWDEFGKHLETMIAEGRTADLIAVQQLSEYVSRSKKIPATLTLFMHQGLMRYASNLPASARMEWAKVGGRFKPIQYVDTSREIYQLMAKIISDLVDSSSEKNIARAKVFELRKLGILKDFNVKKLHALLLDAYPIEPIALHLLPRISSRVAQNERTLFSFLYEQDLSRSIAPDDVYDYFSNEMHADASVGGTSKHWLQTESAIAKCAGDELSEKVLKCACLLGMGLAGERAQVSKELLKVAAAGLGPVDEVAKTIKKLIQQNLLLYRRHTDSVSVWHGTDYDLRGKVDERKNLLRNDFNYIEFLEEQSPPQPWASTRYNVDFHVKRYFPGVYASLESLRGEDIYGLEVDNHFYDGKVIYCILRDDKEIREAKKIASNRKESRLVLIVSNEKAPVFDAALEVKALLDLSHDYEFVSRDPLLPVELNQMLDDARAYLQKTLDRLTSPVGKSSVYISGHQKTVGTVAGFRELLSLIMEKEYNLSPKIKNELLVRRKVSRAIQNARKKLIYGILERAGKAETFGFTESEINTPQASIFRSVLKGPGLYIPGKRKFVSPKDVSDQGLQRVWADLEIFFKTPGEKDISILLSSLQRPPVGVRRGVMPVLFAAGYKAFAKSVVLKKGGVYLNDLTPSTIEDIFDYPESYTLTVLTISNAKRKYLENLADLFAFGEIQEDSEVKQSKELIRQSYEAFIGWRAELPVAALRAKGVTEKAAAFQLLLRGAISPEQFFLQDLPCALGCLKNKYEEVIDATKDVIDELTNIISIYQRDVEVLIRMMFDVEGQGDSASLTEIAKKWVNIFPAEIRNSVFDFVAKRLCDIILDHQDSDERLIDSMALVIVGKGLIHWDDTTYSSFKNKLYEHVYRMQRQILETPLKAKYKSNVEALILFQMRTLLNQYTANSGSKNGDEIMKMILESNCGNNS